MKVHGCCGCSCHICAKGHNTGRGEHTEPCRQRFFDEWERENVECQTCRQWDWDADHPTTNVRQKYPCPECGAPENVETPT